MVICVRCVGPIPRWFWRARSAAPASIARRVRHPAQMTPKVFEVKARRRTVRPQRSGAYGVCAKARP
eukprot:1144414-Lingulodinium_polyedra.AAC.1